MFSRAKKAIVAVAGASLLLSSLSAAADNANQSQTRQIDLAIALDVSGSMEGLIESAKQRLWDIVNELARAKPVPVLRVAVISYGRPSHGVQSGFVRIDRTFTRNLDAVNETLFSYQTDGGDEYVSRVIDVAINDLEWSDQDDALRMLYVVGNESAEQDPIVNLSESLALAKRSDVFVNATYCGNAYEGTELGWRIIADLTDGIYASIDQNTAAVANIASPMDKELAELDEKLNRTYVAFGEHGKKRKSSQLQQDRNAQELSAPTAVSRTITKASPLYERKSWDLVAAFKNGMRLSEVEEEDFPESMQHMDTQARTDFIEKQTKTREKLTARINELAEQRKRFIQKERKTRSGQAKGLDEAMQEAARELAKEKGFKFDDS